MAKDWTSPIYGFFQPCPTIEAIEGRPCHEFICAANLCKGKGVRPRIVRRFLDKNDRNSTSNMHKHAKNCWGEEIVSKVLEGKVNLASTTSVKVYHWPSFIMDQSQRRLRGKEKER